MAVLAAAALLDELMGRNRNIAPHEKGKELNWEDAEYCKFFMVRFCPHDLFVNTKADLGSCAKVHDEEARKLFEDSKPLRKLQYQEEFIRFCTSMLNDVERKIIKGKQRLALSGKGVLPAAGEEGGIGTTGTATTPTTVPNRNQEQIDLLNERINGLVEEAEQAGTHGNVEQAQGLMKLCDQLKDERDQLQRPYSNYPNVPGQHWSATAELAAAQEKQMEVCEVCGAFLIVGDAQQRIEDHLTGKQHMGYARLKAAIDEVGTVIQDVREKEERHGHGRGGGRGYGGDRGGRDRYRGRDSRGGDKVDRERSRSGQRDHRKDRDSGKDRRSGGGGNDRDRKDRDKDRDRGDRDGGSKREKKEGGDKDRDKDRERRHRSDRDSGRDGRSSGGRHSSHRR